jgi:interferon gamma-inducible protein 30
MRTFILFAILALSTQVSTDKLSMSFYVESLCPDSVKTMAAVDAAIGRGLLEIADIELVLAGNAKVTGRNGKMWQFACQHGPEECYGNALEECILHHATQTKTGLRMVACIFAKSHTLGSALPDALEQCAEEIGDFGYSTGAMNQCANGLEGNAYHYGAVQMTPAHKFVPWVTVEDFTLTADDQTMLTQEPLLWACSHAVHSDLKNRVCGSSVRGMLTKLTLSLLD